MIICGVYWIIIQINFSTFLLQPLENVHLRTCFAFCPYWPCCGTQAASEKRGDTTAWDPLAVDRWKVGAVGEPVRRLQQLSQPWTKGSYRQERPQERTNHTFGRGLQGLRL